MGRDNISASKSMRVGILCEGKTLPAWQAQCLRGLLSTDGVSVCLLIINDRPRQRHATRREKWWKLLRGRIPLWDLYYHRRVERLARSLQPVDMTEALEGIDTVRCRTVKQGGNRESFPEDVIRKIEDSRLDMLLRLSFGILQGDILHAARYGVWSFHHGDIDKYRGGPPCFWEMVHRTADTGCVLQRLTERLDAGVILHRGWFKTDEVSYPVNLDAALFGAAEWPVRMCRSLLGGNGRQVDDDPVNTDAPVYRNPTNMQFISYLWRVLKNRVLRKVSWFFRHDQWNVGLVDEPIHTFVDPEAIHSVQWLPTPPRHRFLADPFGVRRDNTTTVLVEDFDYRTRKGRIAAFEGRNGKIERAPAPTIDRAVHMSYPYIVERDGEIYCIPEASEGGGVHLFRALRLPDRWERAGTLIEDFPAVDSTIFRHEGRWWLFCIARGSIPWTRLYGWYADDLLGPWIPHATNPIKMDVRSSRPGGTPFVHNGELYRPAQDCSDTYGGAIALNRVRCLTPDEFEEEIVTFIRPDPHGPFPSGMHTLSAVGDQTLIDGKRYIFAAAGFRHALRSQCRNLVRFVAGCLGRRHDSEASAETLRQHVADHSTGVGDHPHA